MKRICACGCGEEVKKENQYIFNHWKRRQKMSEEQKKLLSKIYKRLYKEGKRKPIRYWLGKKNPQHSKFMKEWFSKKENNPMYGKKHTKKTKKLIGVNSKIVAKRLWKNPVYREKVIRNSLRGLLKRPTSFEKYVINIIKKYNLPYKYVGNGDFILGGKNPDFINVNGEKICVEVYCYYWHPKNYERIRYKHFTKYGWKTIFINEDDVLSNNERGILKKLGGDYH